MCRKAATLSAGREKRDQNDGAQLCFFLRTYAFPRGCYGQAGFDIRRVYGLEEGVSPGPREFLERSIFALPGGKFWAPSTFFLSQKCRRWHFMLIFGGFWPKISHLDRAIVQEGGIQVQEGRVSPAAGPGGGSTPPPTCLISNPGVVPARHIFSMVVLFVISCLE